MCKKLLFPSISILKRFTHNWMQPTGYDTGIKLYNCLIKSKIPLITKQKNLLTWYSCGPTVYDSSHIGHACYFMKLDIIQRILRNYFNYNLITAMNITDIDDKIIKRSLEMKKSCEEITKCYEKQFLEDCQSLNIIQPNFLLRVTENIDVIKLFIQELIEKKTAYQSSDGSIYFSLDMYRNYGKFRNITEDLTDNEENQIKKNPMDFVLWKASKPQEPFWVSNWGPGRPGWHIECSALASHVFGSTIDIHAGGLDLKFPHHENEEAQSCALHLTDQWVNYWLHTGLLHLKNSAKMSKSLKNTITIQELLGKVDATTFRIACAMSHYRSDLEFSWEFMETAQNLLRNYKNFLDNCRNYSIGRLGATVNSDVLNKLLSESIEHLHEALIDDFNTPLVIDILNRILSTVNSMFQQSGNTASPLSPQILALANFLVNSLSLFGVQLDSVATASVGDNSKFVEVMDILNSFRQDVRQLGIATKNQNILRLCDGVRNELKDCGIDVKDYGKVSSWNC